MNTKLQTLKEMKNFLILWGTQLMSSLGSAMTSYALVIWSYTQEGSALMTALLMVCSYAPYVLCSIFAGALSDRWDKKRTLLGCDALAALCTLTVLLLLKRDALQVWHLYIINAVNGLMNTVQQPASELATTLILPKKHYQRVGSLRYFASSLSSILTPIIATAVLGFWGMGAVIAIDLASFALAFAVLLLFVPIPMSAGQEKTGESLMNSARAGLQWLRENRGILHLMLFLAAINLVASMYNAAFPAMMLSKPAGGERAMATVNAVVGMTTLLGSVTATFIKAPKSRVRAIWLCLMLSMSTQNFTLAFGKSLPVWCLGAFLGWIAIPLMNANLDAVFRLSIPENMQGRVFAARNSFQFFTVPLGYLLGGALVDYVFEPFMADRETGLLTALFGTGKGSGAAMLFALLWLMGIAVCLIFRGDREINRIEL